MKRLKSPVADGGLPYLNSDFNDILQKEHLKAYGSFLDGINDWQIDETGTNAQNRGIIMRGCRIVSSTSNSTTFDFTNSLIYMPTLTTDGDFYAPVDAININNYTIGHGGSLYIVLATATDETRIFRDGISKGAITDTRFTITSSQPSLSSTWIQFDWNASLGKIVTRRRYQRVLKYFTANTNDVMMTGNISDFDPSNGLGVGDMYGFALCNGSSGTYDLRGRFIMGYNKDESPTPVDNTSTINFSTGVQTYDSTDIKNYGQIGNFGGGIRDTNSNLTDGREYYGSHRLTSNQLATHTHTGAVGGSGVHKHTIAAGSGFSDGGYLRNGQPGSAGQGQLSVDGGGDGGSHTHTVTINNAGGNTNHETRAPYMVLAYYQKINVS